MLYVGGGCLDASPELREFVQKTGIPVASTFMGLGAFPDNDKLGLQVFASCDRLHCAMCVVCLDYLDYLAATRIGSHSQAAPSLVFILYMFEHA